MTDDEATFDDIRAARRQLDEVIEETRMIPDYEGSLAAPTFGDVAGGAAQQPLVYLAAAEQGGRWSSAAQRSARCRRPA